MTKYLRSMKIWVVLVLTFALICSFGLAGCSSNSSSDSSNTTTSSSETKSESTQLQIFAANSLSKALDEVQKLYTEKNPDVTFADTQYKASGELNEMLKAGSKADIEITASKGTMDTAVEEGYVDDSSRFDMFTNDLVIVAAEDSDIESVDLAEIATGNYTVAVGDDSVPAGNYANQALSTVGCFNDPDGKTGKDSAGKANGTDAYAGTPLAGKVTTQTSVGNVCKLAQTGDAQVAFVYTSDVYRFGGVKIVGTVDSSTHKSIVYPAAVCKDTENSEVAQKFLDWCVEDSEALEIWQKWGFTLAADNK